ncbi:MAG: hypothetical protein NZ992_05740, partial [Candidatus Korarchaeum sp.]|nr:hypothetical protein [Candidatus Korarchaeum sp.]MDW8035636.1 hypothetical protein [Candidatus Korarchaeum sp.]
MAQGLVLIPRSYGEVDDLIRREVVAKGINQSEIKLRAKSVLGDLAVLFDWTVEYYNTSGRRSFADYVSKSGKSIVMGSSTSLRVIDFKRADYSSLVLERDTKVTLRSEVDRIEARKHLITELRKSLRVPKSAIR